MLLFERGVGALMTSLSAASQIALIISSVASSKRALDRRRQRRGQQRVTRRIVMVPARRMQAHAAGAERRSAEGTAGTCKAGNFLVDHSIAAADDHSKAQQQTIRSPAIGVNSTARLGNHAVEVHHGHLVRGHDSLRDAVQALYDGVVLRIAAQHFSTVRSAADKGKNHSRETRSRLIAHLAAQRHERRRGDIHNLGPRSDEARSDVCELLLVQAEADGAVLLGAELALGGVRRAQVVQPELSCKQSTQDEQQD